MSVTIRHVTTGEKTLYIVHNFGVSPVEVNAYENRNDIPESIRHYATEGEPMMVEPDLANYMGVSGILYPNLPKCKHPEYLDQRCIAENCKFAKPTYHQCPYFDNSYNERKK